MTNPTAKTANELAMDRTDLAVERTVMGAGRTLMAWIRTALSMISFGFTIYKFLQAAAEGKANSVMQLMGPRVEIGDLEQCALAGGIGLQGLSWDFSSETTTGRCTTC